MRTRVMYIILDITNIHIVTESIVLFFYSPGIFLTAVECDSGEM